VLNVGFGINSKKKFLGKCLVKKKEIFMLSILNSERYEDIRV